MAKFFIDRPIFAWVLAIMLMLTGALSLKGMALEQYPSVAPPTILITATLPGASAETLETSVTQVIEQSLIGIDNMRYFSASSASSGVATILITFEPGTNPDTAQVQVQNKVQAVQTLLPASVRDQGISVLKANSITFLVPVLYSKTGNTSQEEISDILISKVKDEIARINGVGTINTFGAPRAMRIWLDPNKLYTYNLSTDEIITAIKTQNVDVVIGALGGLPSAQGQQLNASIIGNSKFTNVKEFENIIIKAKINGSLIHLKDIAKIELGSQDYGVISRYKRLPASGLSISLASGANALEVADAIKAKMKEFSASLPEDLEVAYPYDTTPFVRLSIKSVIHTLIEAFILVFIIMFLFLQNIRATLIPAIAIPVVLLGTLAVLNAFGFSLNILTMFGMVLSIGLLVDDAIVVVENVERLMHEENLSPLEATRKSMNQIQGALVGIAIVLSAVFVPMAFFSGSAGIIYKQFSIAIVSSMALSVLVALVLSPSLCATLLKKDEKKSVFTNNRFFRFFNQKIDNGKEFYATSSGNIATKTLKFIIIYVLMLGGIAFLFLKMPTSFLPTEDQGMIYVAMNTPPSATSERTLESVKMMENYLLEKESENVEHLFTTVGWSFSGVAQNTAFGFVALNSWDKRTRKDQSISAISGRIFGMIARMKDAGGFAFFPPPIRELGNASGFDIQIIDTGGLGHAKLMEVRGKILYMASQNPLLTGVRPNGLDDVPQYKLEVDYEKAKILGIEASSINNTLQAAWGSVYVGDFIDSGRVKKVYVQSDSKYRMLSKDVKKWYIKNSSGEMVSFSSFSSGSWIYGSPKLERFRGFPSINIQGSPAAGVSSGVAMQEIEKIVKQMPKGIDIAYQGLSFEERASGNKALPLYILSILIVFLSLAALYESWKIPISVLFTIPFGFAGALIASSMFGLSNDVYFQIALLTTIGLSAKNAILIIEFAKKLQEDGYSISESLSMATKQRFRPIIMTSMAFILGVIPLAIASGAGSVSQNAIGISVIGGMLFSTFVAPLFVPLFYSLVSKKEQNNSQDLIKKIKNI